MHITYFTQLLNLLPQQDKSAAGIVVVIGSRFYVYREDSHAVRKFRFLHGVVGVTKADTASYTQNRKLLQLSTHIQLYHVAFRKSEGYCLT